MPAPSDATEHLRLVRAEEELLEGTLRGAVTVLTEILGIRDPAAVSRGDAVEALCASAGGGTPHRRIVGLRAAAMLSAIGYAVVPGDIVDRARAGEQLTDAERHCSTRTPLWPANCWPTFRVLRTSLA